MRLWGCSVSVSAAEVLPSSAGMPRLRTVIPVLGVTQILARATASTIK